jgi:hypothetical protein
MMRQWVVSFTVVVLGFPERTWTLMCILEVPV